MIDQETLLSLKTWFSEYVKKFQLSSPPCQQNINLKEENGIKKINNGGKKSGRNPKSLKNSIKLIIKTVE